MPKRSKNVSQRPARPRWAFDPGVPTDKWFVGRSLDEMWNLQEAVADFVFSMEEGRFLIWEAVMCQEQGLPLTAGQKRALCDLIDFRDKDEELDDRILYVDEIPRPSEPWDVILNKIVPHLLIEPFRTDEIQAEVKLEGFTELMEALRKHGQDLSLPAGVTSHEEVVPVELRHKLWLQACFGDLNGLGQEPELNVEEQPERLEWFIDHLRDHKGSVQFLELTLESLVRRLILPQGDQQIFLAQMQERLEISSVGEPIADHL